MPQEPTIEQEITEVVKEAVENTPVNIDFPEVQKVEVINQEKAEKPDFSTLEAHLKGILVEAKKTPDKVDLSGLEELVENLLSTTNKVATELKKEKKEIDYSAILNDINKNIPTGFDFERLESAIAKIPRGGRGGGAIGPSKYVLKRASDGVAIDPATSNDTMKALDTDGDSKELELTGVQNDQLKVMTDMGHLLREILVELKINNKHLSLLTEVEWEEHNIEE